MVALPNPLWGASPLNANDANRLLFTADLDAEVQSRTLDNTPPAFLTMNSLSWELEWRTNLSSGDDSIGLSIRVMNGGTVLAAADAGGTFATAKATNTAYSTADVSIGPTAFSYVNTTADKAAWDGASVELRQNVSKNMGADGVRIEVDYVVLTGDYEADELGVNSSSHGHTSESAVAFSGSITSPAGGTSEDPALPISITYEHGNYQTQASLYFSYVEETNGTYVSPAGSHTRKYEELYGAPDGVDAEYFPSLFDYSLFFHGMFGPPGLEGNTDINQHTSPGDETITVKLHDVYSQWSDGDVYVAAVDMDTGTRYGQQSQGASFPAADKTFSVDFSSVPGSNRGIYVGLDSNTVSQAGTGRIDAVEWVNGQVAKNVDYWTLERNSASNTYWNDSTSQWQSAYVENTPPESGTITANLPGGWGSGTDTTILTFSVGVGALVSSDSVSFTTIFDGELDIESSNHAHVSDGITLPGFPIPQVMLSHPGNSIKFWDLTGSTISVPPSSTLTYDNPESSGQYRGLAVNPDDADIFYVTNVIESPGEIYEYELSTGTRLRVITTNSALSLRDCHFDNSGQFWATDVSRLQRIDLSTGVVQQTITLSSVTCTTFFFDPDGTHIWIYSGTAADTIYKMTWTGQTIVDSWVVGGDSVDGIGIDNYGNLWLLRDPLQGNSYWELRDKDDVNLTILNTFVTQSTSDSSEGISFSPSTHAPNPVPDTPIITSPSDGGIVQGAAVQLQATVYDPAEYVRARWEIRHPNSNHRVGEYDVNLFGSQGDPDYLDLQGFAWTGTHLWATSLVGDLIKFDLSQYPTPNRLEGYTLSSGSNTRGVAWDGTNLWVCEYFAELIHKVDPSNGTILNSYAARSRPIDITWDGTNLWVLDYALRISRTDPSDGSRPWTFLTPGYPDDNPVGLAWDGSYLCLLQDDQTIERMDVTGDVYTFIDSFSYYQFATGTPRGLEYVGRNYLAGRAGNGDIVLVVDELLIENLDNASNVVPGSTHTTTWDTTGPNYDWPGSVYNGQYLLRSYAVDSSGLESPAYDEITVSVHDVFDGTLNVESSYHGMSSGSAPIHPDILPPGLLVRNWDSDEYFLYDINGGLAFSWTQTWPPNPNQFAFDGSRYVAWDDDDGPMEFDPETGETFGEVFTFASLPSPTTSAPRGGTIHPDTGNHWVLWGHTTYNTPGWMYEYNPSNGSVVSSFTIPSTEASDVNYGVCITRDNEIWLAEWSVNLGRGWHVIVFDTSGNYVTNFKPADDLVPIVTGDARISSIVLLPSNEVAVFVTGQDVEKIAIYDATTKAHKRNISLNYPGTSNYYMPSTWTRVPPVDPLLEKARKAYADNGRDRVLHSSDEVSITESETTPQVVAQDSGHSHTSEQVALTEHATLSVEPSAHAHVSDQATIPITYSLEPQESSHTHLSENVTVTYRANAPPNDSWHGHTSEQASISAAYSLVTGDASHGHSSDPVAISTTHSVAPQDSLHAHASEQIAATHSYASVVGDSQHAHASEPISLTENPSLLVEDSLHAHSAEKSTAVPRGSVDANDSYNLHSSEQVSLTEHISVAVDGSAHGHTSEPVTIDHAYALAVDESSHVHGSAPVALAENPSVSIEDSWHGHASETSTVTSVHSLAVDDSSHGHVSDGIDASSSYDTLAQDAHHALSSDETTVVPSHSLDPGGSSHAVSSDATAVTENPSLLVEGSQHLHTADKGTALPEHALDATDSYHAHTSEPSNLTEHATVTVDDSQHGHASEQVTASPTYALVVGDASHAHIATQPTTSASYVAVVDDSAHIQASDEVVVSTSYEVTTEDAQHALSSDEGSISATYEVAPDDAVHAHASDPVTLTEHAVLAVEDSLHAHSAEKGTALPEHALDSTDSYHGHASEPADLTEHASVEIEDSTHAASSDEASATATYVLAPQESSHGHTSELVTASASYVLAVDDATSAHVSDEAAVSTSYTVAPLDATHGHSVDEATAAATYVLDTGDATHVQSSDPVSIVENPSLTVDDSWHDHTSEKSTAVPVGSVVVQGVSHVHVSDEVSLTEHASVVADDSLHISSSDEAIASATYVVAPQGSLHEHASESFSITSNYPLLVGDSNHEHASESAEISVSYAASPQDAHHDHVSGESSITSLHVLAVDDAMHESSSDPVTVTEHPSLLVEDSSHTHTAEKSTAVPAGSVDANDANHAHASDSATLTEHAVFAVEDSEHVHTSSEATTNATYVVAPQDSLHSASSDEVDVSGHATVSIEDASHVHTSNNAVVTSSHAVVAGDSSHGHASEQASITEHPSLTVEDSQHSHTSDSVSAVETSAAGLPVNDSMHAHSSGVVALGVVPLLVPTDATHAHNSSNATLVLDVDPRVVDIEVEAGEFGLNLTVDSVEPLVSVHDGMGLLLEVEQYVAVVAKADEEAI